MTIQHIQKLMIYTEPNKKIVMKKKYEKPTFDVIEMDKEHTIFILVSTLDFRLMYSSRVMSGQKFTS